MAKVEGKVYVSKINGPIHSDKTAFTFFIKSHKINELIIKHTKNQVTSPKSAVPDQTKSLEKG